MSTACDLYVKGLDQRFSEFHAENPHVFVLFERFSDEARIRGRKRIGAKMIVERIRWYTQVETNGDSFKINNSYTSRYVRLLTEKRPDLAPLFETRKLKA